MKKKESIFEGLPYSKRQYFLFGIIELMLATFISIIYWFILNILLDIHFLLMCGFALIFTGSLVILSFNGNINKLFWFIIKKLGIKPLS